jgi:hypothetical protein
MAQLPEQIEPTVAARAMPVPQVNPNTYGAAVAQGAEKVAQDVNQIAHRERLLAVQFDASDRELKYGEQADALVDEYKTQHKALTDSSPENYQKSSIQLQQQYSAKLEQLRTKVGGTLSDQLALKQFDVRTRLQTQAAVRHMMLFGDSQVQEWRQHTMDGVVKNSINHAADVSGDITSDVQHIAEQTGLAHDALQRLSNLPPDALKEKMAEVDKHAVHGALDAYGMNYEAGLALLNAKLPDGTRVAYNHDHPDEPAILNTAEVAKWEKHFKDAKASKVGVDLGAQFFLTKERNIQDKLTALVQQGNITYAEAGKAYQQYTSLVGDAHRMQEIGESSQLNSTFDSVMHNYDGDLEKAKADPKFLAQYARLPGKLQLQVEQSMKKEERDDPAKAVEFAKELDNMRSPGWSDKVDPEVFKARLIGLGPVYRKKALELFEKDKERDPGSDINDKAILDDAESRVRVGLDYKRDPAGHPERSVWDSASDVQRDLHLQAMLKVHNLIAGEKDATKKKGPSATHAVDLQTGVNEIIREMTVKYQQNRKLKGEVWSSQRDEALGLDKKPDTRPRRNGRVWNGTKWVVE